MAACSGGTGDTSAAKYSIGGIVSGLAGQGLVLQNQGGDDLTIGADGSFRFPTDVPNGAAYAVTVRSQPRNPAQTCSVNQGSGSVAERNIDDVRVACATNAYVIGGTVSGLAGSGLTLQNNAGDDLALGADGAFRFSQPVASGAGYSVTVRTQPSAPAQTCTVGNASATVTDADIGHVNVLCSTNAYRVGGTVHGLTGTGLILQNNSADDLPLAADGSFRFATPVASGAGYAVTVRTQPEGQTCTVANGSASIGGADVDSVTVSCSDNLYTIGGSVSGLTGTLVLRNNGGDALTVSGNGAFRFSTRLGRGAAYHVTVGNQPAGQTCSVANASAAVGSADITNVIVSCAASQYVIGGSVSGLVGTLVLRNNGSDDLTIAANGRFSFPRRSAAGAGYSVTVHSQPTEQTCAVARGNGVANADVADVDVVCTVKTYTIGGTVTGLNGGTLVLRNNGGDELAIVADGPFSFPTRLPAGVPYAADIKYQPRLNSGACSIGNSAGTVAGAVGDISVSCAAPALESKWAYLRTEDGTLHSFTVNPADGQLGAATGTVTLDATDARTVPGALVVDPRTELLYVARNGQIGGYAINPTTGRLTEIHGSPFVATGAAPTSLLAMHPSGRFLYLAESGMNTFDGLHVYKIANDGSVAAVPGPVVASPRYLAKLVIDPTGRFLYAVDTNMLSTYRIDETSGQLTSAGPAHELTNRRVDAFAMAPTGRYLFFMAWDRLTTWQTDQVSGLPREVAQGPVTALDGYGLAVDPQGKFLISYQISLDHSRGLGVHRIAADGKLTEVPGSPFPTLTSLPAALVVAPSGKFLYYTDDRRNLRAVLDPVSGQLTGVDTDLTFLADVRSITIAGR